MQFEVREGIELQKVPTNLRTDSRQVLIPKEVAELCCWVKLSF